MDDDGGAEMVRMEDGSDAEAVREGGRGQERAVSKVEITVWRRVRTAWRVRRREIDEGIVEWGEEKESVETGGSEALLELASSIVDGCEGVVVGDFWGVG